MSIRAATWIAGLVILAAAFILVVHLSANNMEFSRYNAGWNGTSQFFFDLDRHRISDISEPSQLAGYPRNTTLLIIAPNRNPTPGEIAAYSAFLKDGGTIFLADDFGSGNAILNGIGSHITILPGNLSSLDRRYADPYMVVAYRSVEDGQVLLPADIALDRPAALDGGTPLMLSSVMSWSDANGDKRLNMGESMGMFPVMASEDFGNGRLIVLSDPSIFINSMYTQPENANNRLFIDGLVNGEGKILIDQMNSRTSDANGFSGVLHLLRNTIIIEVLIIGILMLGTAWAWKRKIV